jgi:3-phenylpropionate/trans-cinnamate dioxygenase ferredoxin reductase component
VTSVVVIGAGLAGLRAAQTLRADGFDGELTVIGAEPHLPYDRPPLSKGVLLGEAEACDIALADAYQYAAIEATWLLDCHATGLRRGGVRVGDITLNADGVVIATGARARLLPFCGAPGVHTLRTLDDALALRGHLKDAAHVAIIGAGFIGTEVASAAVTLGCRVTVTMAEPSPLVDKVGTTVSTVLRQTMLDNGVEVKTGVLAEDMQARADGTLAVLLTDRSWVSADAIVVGCGAIPNTEWLQSSEIELGDGVLTDNWGRTSIPGVVAAGDVASRRRGAGRLRVEHWTHARDMSVVAARSLLAYLRGDEPPAPYTAEPYFWSDQFGVRLQVAGTVDAAREFQIVDGAVGEHQFLAAQFDGERPRSIVGFNAPRAFTQWRRRNKAALAAAQ